MFIYRNGHNDDHATQVKKNWWLLRWSDPNKRWNRIPKYPDVTSIIQFVLSLSHGNNAPESRFSLNKRIFEIHYDLYYCLFFRSLLFFTLNMILLQLLLKNFESIICFQLFSDNHEIIFSSYKYVLIILSLSANIKIVHNNP